MKKKKDPPLSSFKVHNIFSKRSFLNPKIGGIIFINKVVFLLISVLLTHTHTHNLTGRKQKWSRGQDAMKQRKTEWFFFFFFWNRYISLGDLSNGWRGEGLLDGVKPMFYAVAWPNVFSISKSWSVAFNAATLMLSHVSIHVIIFFLSIYL